MITQIIACCAWCGTVMNPAPQVFGPLPANFSQPRVYASTTSTRNHLRSFVDARKLSSGDPVFTSSPLLPRITTPGAAEVETLLTKPLPPKPKTAKTATGKEKAPATNAKAVAPNPTVASAKPSKNPEDALCSINASGAKIADVVSELTDKTHVNVILAAPSDATVTLRLTGVKLVDALHHLCATTGLAYLKAGSAFVIATEEKLKASYPKEWEAAHPKEQIPVAEKDPGTEEISRSYATNFVDANILSNALTAVYGNDKIKCVAVGSQSAPGITNQDKSSAIGVNAGVIAKDGASDKYSRLLMIRGPRALVEAALQDAIAMDVSRAQVRIMVTIHDVSNDALRNTGFEWQLPNLEFNEAAPKSGVFGTFSRQPLSFVANLKALETHNDAKLLASPEVSVMDNESAQVLIGQKLTFPVLIGYTQANTPIFNKEEEKVGIYLQVKANITKDNLVTLTLYPQVSTVTGFINVNGAEYPQISTREAQTTLQVGSGETIVMAGLLSSSDIVDVQKVPFLSKIPILGEFFTRRRKTKSASQIVITLTPTVLPRAGQ